VAHLIFPNYTEAAYLTDPPYKKEGITFQEAKELIEKLRAMGTLSALITSVLVDGQTSVVGYNHVTEEYFLLPYTEIPVHFPGTGDLFSAILIGHFLNGKSLDESTSAAIDALYRLIDANKDNVDKNRGIPVENYLNML
jgi:pyridoxine kinase